MNSNQKQKNALANNSKKKSAIFSRQAFREAIDKNGQYAYWKEKMYAYFTGGS